MFRAARESGQSCEAQVRFRHPDGRTIWLGIRMRVTCDESGAPATMSGLCTDITEQKEAQIRIAFQASLLDAVEQAVVATDPEGRIVYFNKFAERLYGWTAAEALGRDAGELTTGSAEDARSRAAAAGGGSWSGEIVLTRRDGTTFPAHMTDSPVFDPAGRPLGRVGVSYDLTERKQAEAELREKSVLLGATLENMDQGLVVADPDGRVSLFNRRALELMSLPLEFMARRPTLAEVKDFQLQRSEFATLDDALRGVAQSRHFLDDPSVYERARPDGTVLEFRTVRLPDGGAVRTYTDVTAWRQAEAELRASEERYRTLVTATSSILWRAKPDGSIFQVIGFDDYPGPQEDLLGYGWLDLIHPDDREEHACDWQAIVASDAPRESHYRFITANGDYRWVACRAVPLKGPDGTVREWAGYLTDIHERKQADEALRRSREELRAALEANRAIIEHSLDVICTLDEDGAFAQVSPRASDIWGYTPEELVGRRYIDLVHPDDVAMTDQVADRIMAGHPTFSFENRLVRKDGSAVPLLWSAVWSEEHRAMFCIARDLTERLRTEERLRQAHKMEAVGQLTGGIAHDFNNLLTVILGNAEILTEDASDPDRVRELATLILEASTRGADLTRHLLAFGRRQTLKPVRLHLDHVVHGLVPLLRRTLGEHIELRTEFVPCRLSALTDRTLLENALLNLVVNARDAMPHGGVLTISTAQRGAGPGEGPLPIGQDVVVVTVSDTGTGMSPEVMERVFEPFFTTKEVGKGSGLGLAMVYGFAQQCGGHVAIASKEGRGTAVTIVLPAIVGQAAEEGAAPIVVPRHTGKERVLLVEDEPQVLQFVSAQLLNLGYQVTAVTNGVDAVGILEQDRNFDLLLTDLVLPKGMSGIDLSQFARRIKPDLRVLYTSGYSEEVFRQHGRFEDSIPLLSKPYRGKELARMLRTVLDAPPVPLA
jgi:PAS domain S-box-containing protein